MQNECARIWVRSKQCPDFSDKQTSSIITSSIYIYIYICVCVCVCIKYETNALSGYLNKVSFMNAKIMCSVKILIIVTAL